MDDLLHQIGGPPLSKTMVGPQQLTSNLHGATYKRMGAPQTIGSERSTTYPSATADGTDCVQARRPTFEAWQCPFGTASK